MANPSASQINAQIRAAQRRAEQKFKQEVDRVNRANKKAVDDYNRKVTAQNKRVVDDYNRKVGTAQSSVDI
ncbi:hypothetical protein [Aeromicrobium fastidiosum]|uniref:Uncharacterized protein n=1 Tax=Aeromicrobium fastidiosum TaxID=52699 RepID=A0A641AQ95_9ACTN|nr:hypothetical protein [Aeromicrobium fastidiosum]KAA1378567.1 hypothetical protein ESP62_009495 [Aeromicrobium fastidiosum]MBP2392459.1 hypothetical protein [Aeromicrobium fastidiosum]